MTPDEFTKREFTQRIIQSPRPAIVVFGITEERTTRDTIQAATEFAKRTPYTVHAIDIGDSSELAEEFLIMASPTVLVFHGGTPVATVQGSLTVEEIARLTAGAAQ